MVASGGRQADQRVSNGTNPGNSSATDPASRTASRQTAGDPSFSAITPDYETRKIIMARGIQFQNPSSGEYAIPDYLVSRIGSDVTVLDDGTAVYNSDKQHVSFVITNVTTKSDFKTALQTDGVHVVYCGHARFGQGMCFGDNARDAQGNLIQGEDWGKGTDPHNTGLWRVGFPYIALPVQSDILEHGYTVNPVLGSQDKPASSDCHPHTRQNYSSMSVMDISTFDSGLPSFLGSVDTSGGFWGFNARSEAGKYERHILVNAGWTATDEDPLDLGGTQMTCKCFTCIACSTFVHNYPIVRFLNGWKRDGDDKYAYWTTNATSGVPMTAFFLYRLLTYPTRNDNQPWANSLNYAVRKANQDYSNLLAQGAISISSQLY
jgi:hypothetical protein